MSTHGWFRHHRAESATAGEVIIQAVNRCGVKLTPVKKAIPSGVGRVLFDHVDAELCETLDRDSRHGFDRVLALAASSDALGRGATWRLLEAGAADDVLAWDAMPDPAATVAARFERYERGCTSPIARGARRTGGRKSGLPNPEGFCGERDFVVLAAASCGPSELNFRHGRLK
jgi:hypothetical protein